MVSKIAQVLVVAEIGKDHAVKNDSGYVKENTGYALNDLVEVTSRFTCHFYHEKTEYRKDVAVGEHLRVTGCREMKNGTFQLRVLVRKEQDGVGTLETDWFVKLSTVKRYHEVGADPKKEKSG